MTSWDTTYCGMLKDAVRPHNWVNTHTHTHRERERESEREREPHLLNSSKPNHPEALILHSKNTVDTYFYHALFIYLCFIALSNKSGDFIILRPLSTSTHLSFSLIRDRVLARHNTATYRKYTVRQSVIGQYLKVLQTNLYLSVWIRKLHINIWLIFKPLNVNILKMKKVFFIRLCVLIIFTILQGLAV